MSNIEGRNCSNCGTSDCGNFGDVLPCGKWSEWICNCVFNSEGKIIFICSNCSQINCE